MDDSCDKLASRCGISGSDFTKYNSGSNFCATLRSKQHVCCSSGDLPDTSPSPGADGTCYAYQVKAEDNCDDLAAEYSLTRQKLEDFNKNTWGWNGCKLLFIDTIMCLSKGEPPFPAPIVNAVCGPQKPGSKPQSGTDISELNPCPLNACCNVWGQCGITKDFCVDTNTGAPGTAKPDTYGCISNCGTDVVKGDGSGAIKLGYFEGYNLGRKCLFQDASQIDTSQYTHIHFGFGTLTTNYEVKVGDVLSTYQFGEFKKIKGTKRILSFGGWSFSTEPATYTIFREGVTPANRLTMATNIANFIKEHDLDGVDIDWEYPGAPDIPGIPSGSKDDGPNYLAFLVILKNLLRGKSISIAAPSSYWYLKQYPLKEMSRIVDYIVYMTYDLQGQWDADNAYSQEGCDSGSCLRSQVNLTETRNSLAMITKAGVPGWKVVVGVTSYGRSFSMVEEGCWGPQCHYTGNSQNSDATRGSCTDTPGYLADAEIEEILKDSSRVVKSFVDPSSNSDVLVYDNNQWVGYMSSRTKNTRASLYKAWGMGGTTDWATDLKKYHDVPAPAKSWGIFKELAQSGGGDPKRDTTRSSDWTKYDCTNSLIVFPTDYRPTVQWKGLGADAAWSDVVRVWVESDKPQDKTFSHSVQQTLQIATPQADCGSLVADHCNAQECGNGQNGGSSGPAAQLIWDSLVVIHTSFKDYYNKMYQVTSIFGLMIDDLENKFAPIPAEESNKWMNFLIDMVTVGALSVAGPFFNSYLKAFPYFAQGAKLDNAKDTTMTLIGQSTIIAKDLLDPKSADPWTPEAQKTFKASMGLVIMGWGKIVEGNLASAFSGEEDSLKLLGNAMADGKLIEGKAVGAVGKKPTKSDLQDQIFRTFFGYAIPRLWRATNTHAFVIDSGYDCGAHRLSEYVDEKTMEATSACVDGRQYYLVHPKGPSRSCVCTNKNGCDKEFCKNNRFSSPPGLDSLGSGNFAGVKRTHLITGAVRTWLQNGKSNDGSFVDMSNKGTQMDILDNDITTPGFVRLPVCSPNLARQRWQNGAPGDADYPCNIPRGPDLCGHSTFEDRTSDVSPLVETAGR